jgi:hypothetical protein
MVDNKEAQFNRLWNEESDAKRVKFRNYMKAKLDVLHVEFTEENARAYYNGRLTVWQPERIYQAPERERPQSGRRGPRPR